jgi:hypothetical protein
LTDDVANSQDDLNRIARLNSSRNLNVHLHQPGDQPNPAWTANAALAKEISEAGKAGIRVVHRVSIPSFELAHLPVDRDDLGYVKFPPDRDKPWRMLTAISENADAAASVRRVLEELLSGAATEAPFGEDYVTGLSGRVVAWGKTNSAGDPRFVLRALAGA